MSGSADILPSPVCCPENKSPGVLSRLACTRAMSGPQRLDRSDNGTVVEMGRCDAQPENGAFAHELLSIIDERSKCRAPAVGAKQ